MILGSACEVGESFVETNCPGYDESLPLSKDQFDRLVSVTECRSGFDAPIDDILDEALLAFPDHGVTADQVTVHFSSEPLRFTLPTQPTRREWRGLSYGYSILVHWDSDEMLSDTALAHELAHTVLYEINGGFTADSQYHTAPLWFDEYTVAASEIIRLLE